MKTVKDYYRKRFPKYELKQKDMIWQILCHDFFEEFVGENDVVMDIGGGYCEFINNIKCKSKIAVDINPDTRKFANKDVKIVNSLANKIPSTFNERVDKIFMSNFLEHLATKEEVIETLDRCHSLLKRKGKIMILQPNISLIGNKYWDFIDHKVALNELSVIEAMKIVGFDVELSIERFLPYTTKSKLPQLPFFVRAYLMIPPRFRPMAAQSFFVGIKN